MERWNTLPRESKVAASAAGADSTQGVGAAKRCQCQVGGAGTIAQQIPGAARLQGQVPFLSTRPEVVAYRCRCSAGSRCIAVAGSGAVAPQFGEQPLIGEEPFDPFTSRAFGQPMVCRFEMCKRVRSVLTRPLDAEGA